MVFHVTAIVIATKIGPHATTKLGISASSTPISLGPAYSSRSDIQLFQNVGIYENLQDQPTWVITNRSGISDFRESLSKYVSGNPREVSIYKNSHILSKACAIRLKLLAGTHTMVTCISKLEIWGKVLPSNPPEKLERFYQLYQSIPKSVEPELSTLIQKIPSLEEIDEIITQKQIRVPNEFLDPITHQIMLNPLTTPSGNILDRSTCK